MEKENLTYCQMNHDIKESIRFLENLYNEILIADNIKKLQDPNVLKKFRQTIEFLQNILST